MAIYYCKDPLDLIHQLHRLHDLDRKAQWYFRGQGSSSWGLVPGLLRDDIEIWEVHRKAFELHLLKQLHGTLSNRTTTPDRLLDRENEVDRVDETYLLPLAQHYGAPTRLLDWTLAPLVAAYFAATSALQLRSKSLSVFCMEHDAHREYHEQGGLIVYPRSGLNENQAAQRGIAMLHPWEVPDYWQEKHTTVTDDPTNIDRVESLLVRLDLIGAHAGKLLALLNKRGIDGTAIYPGPHGHVHHALGRAYSSIR